MTTRLCLLGFLMICAAGARIVDQADPGNFAKLEKFVELTPFERVAKLEPYDDDENVAELEPYEEVFAKLIEKDEDDTDLLLDEEEDEDEVEESTTFKVGKQKVVKRKLLKKYPRLQRMLKNVEKKLNKKERKFVQLKK